MDRTAPPPSLLHELMGDLTRTMLVCCEHLILLAEKKAVVSVNLFTRVMVVIIH